MSTIMELLRTPETTTVAVVGATDRPGKYGGIIYRDLKAKGFTVFGVNPYRDSVDGDRSYRTLDDLPEAPDLVDYVVPPARTLEVLQDAERLGYTTAFVQPGAEDDDVIEFLDDHGFDYLANTCIMVRS
ncbi:MAG: CoA-binding protein [Acidimicrobiia bacterium]|nr:CoA-binding protein [Acidimicrobiia bacterium]